MNKENASVYKAALVNDEVLSTGKEALKIAVKATTVLDVVSSWQQVLEIHVERVSSDQQLSTLCNRHTDVILYVIRTLDAEQRSSVLHSNMQIDRKSHYA